MNTYDIVIIGSLTLAVLIAVIVASVIAYKEAKNASDYSEFSKWKYREDREKK